MEKIKKFFKSEKILWLVLILLVILIAIFMIIKNNNQKKEEDEQIRYQEKVEEAKEYIGQILLKEKVYLKNEKISQNIDDYLLYAPDAIEVKDIKLDLSNIDNTTAGRYAYYADYYETKMSSTIYIVETEEEKAMIEEEFNAHDKDILDNIKKEQDKIANGYYDVEKDPEPTPEKPNEGTEDEKPKENEQVDPDIDRGSATSTPLTGTKPLDRNITKYTSNFTNEYESTIKVEMPNYKNELWYIFENQIVMDAWGASAYWNWYNGAGVNAMQTESYRLAKDYFGNDANWCVQYSELIAARNKDNDVVGVVLKAVIGKADTNNACSIDTVTVYSNKRITMYQDNNDYIFKER